MRYKNSNGQTEKWRPSAPRPNGSRAPTSSSSSSERERERKTADEWNVRCQWPKGKDLFFFLLHGSSHWNPESYKKTSTSQQSNRGGWEDERLCAVTDHGRSESIKIKTRRSKWDAWSVPDPLKTISLHLWWLSWITLHAASLKFRSTGPRWWLIHFISRSNSKDRSLACSR